MLLRWRVVVHVEPAVQRVHRDVDVLLLLRDLRQQLQCRQTVGVALERAIGGGARGRGVTFRELALCFGEVGSDEAGRLLFLRWQQGCEHNGGQQGEALAARGHGEHCCRGRGTGVTTGVGVQKDVPAKGGAGGARGHVAYWARSARAGRSPKNSLFMSSSPPKRSAQRVCLGGFM